MFLYTCVYLYAHRCGYKKRKEIMSIVDALKNGKVEYTGNKSTNVKIELGNGNANIDVRGNNVDITTGTGNQNIVVLGNDVDIQLDTNALADWDSSFDKDTVAVVSDEGRVSIDTGDGNDTALTVADNVDIKMGEGSHLIGFWGDDVTITAGNGSNTIMTMDKMLAAGIVDEGTSILGEKVGQAIVDAVEASTTVNTDLIKGVPVKVANGMSKEDFLSDMQKKYNLSNAQVNVLSRLYDDGKLEETCSDGTPRYAIVQSGGQDNKKGEYVVARVDSSSGDGGHIHAWGWYEGLDYEKWTNKQASANGDYGDCIATNQATNGGKQTETGVYKTEDTYEREDTIRTTHIISGTKNLTINIGDADTNYIDVTSTGMVNIKAEDFNLSTIKIDAEVKAVVDKKVKDVYTQPGKTISWVTNLTSTYTSPIVIDFNKDGKVSAESGAGVDVDGNGVADGAATGGDKMLAMSDINGNGQIDGSEVFGDQTVSPFTGEKINAANGFEALKVIAQQAEEKTGIKCYSGGLVDLQALKTALATVGVNLGLISEDNVNELEDLAHVVALNVDNYNEVAEDGDVQHRQQGSYVADDGQTYGADDVWFKNRTQIDDMIDRLKKSK